MTDRQAAILGLNATGVAGQRELRIIEEKLGPLETPGLAAPRELRLPRRIRSAMEHPGLVAIGQLEAKDAESYGLSVAIFEDECFPRRLLCLANPPLALYWRGTLPPDEQPAVGVVGSRRCSRYALRVADSIARDLASLGIVVVSGLARGVDASAHRGSLGDKRCALAILGCGMASIYPPEHTQLALDIESSGAVLSEFGPEVAPLARNFPRRNRLIAGFSDALLVIEARQKSGALITARWAADLGKDVFVVPNQVDNAAAEGSLALLRDGARPIRDAKDLIQDMGWEDDEVQLDLAAVAQEPRSPASDLEQADLRLLTLLDHEAAPLDAILGGLGMSAGEALTRLMALELKGEVEQLPGMCFRRANNK
ncbi:MAG: DNA-processing protein DprA [Planctomycetota bacterium]